MSVILINPFEVPAGSEERFERSWEQALAYMKQQPGFIATSLHRSLGPDARFRFVNVAEWESPRAFMSAVQNPEFQALSQGSPPNFPALYEVVKTEGINSGGSTEGGL